MPQIRGYIDKNASAVIDIKIKDAHFHYFRGFVFNELRISAPDAKDGEYILYARMADIDLNWLSLIYKRIEIKRVSLLGARMNISRDPSGKWNIGPLLRIDSSEGKDSLRIREFRMQGFHIDYADYLKSGDTLKQGFDNADLVLRSAAGQGYKLDVLLVNKVKNEEALVLRIEYNRQDSSLRGWAKINTKRVGKYWEYYLDEWFKPWYLDADTIAAETQFSYIGGVFTFSARYTVRAGILKYAGFTITGDASVNQQLTNAKDSPGENTIDIELSLDNGSFLSGSHLLFSKIQSQAVINRSEISIKQMSGLIFGFPAELNGKFIMDKEPREFSLSGRIFNMDNLFDFKVFADNKAILDWQANAADSYYKIHADISDLEKLAFALTAQGNMRLENILSALGRDKGFLKGQVIFTGAIKGDMFHNSSFEGDFLINTKKFSLFRSEPQIFTTQAVVKEGVLTAELPRIDFYNGTLDGAVKFDAKRWAAEVHLNKFDITDFKKYYPGLQEINKGLLSIDIACISDWADLSNIKGRGNFVLSDCELRNGPFSSNLESGISSIIKGFILPDFKKITGNVEIGDKSMYLESFCSSAVLNLGLKGSYAFDKKVSFTVGATILGGSFLKTMRRIIFPVTIGFDMVANSIQVDINGQWPDLEHKTTIRIGNLLNDFLGLLKEAHVSKPSLDSLWQ